MLSTCKRKRNFRTKEVKGVNVLPCFSSMFAETWCDQAKHGKSINETQWPGKTTKEKQTVKEKENWRENTNKIFKGRIKISRNYFCWYSHSFIDLFVSLILRLIPPEFSRLVIVLDVNLDQVLRICAHC